MKFSSVPISTGSLESARRNPSSATILTLPGVISVSMPVSMPLASSALAANAVFLTMSLKVSQLNVSLLIISLLSFIWGKSSTDSPITLNSDELVFIRTLFSSPASKSIISFGSFLTISPKSFDATTADPGSSTSASIFLRMLISRSDADRVMVPSVSASISMPLSTGSVVLVDTALETVPSAFESVCCLHVNFIIYIFLQIKRENE